MAAALDGMKASSEVTWKYGWFSDGGRDTMFTGEAARASRTAEVDPSSVALRGPLMARGMSAKMAVERWKRIVAVEGDARLVDESD